jgi:hypothetical protein
MKVTTAAWQLARPMADDHRLQRQLLQRLVRHGRWNVAHGQPCSRHRKVGAAELQRLVCRSPLAPWPVACGHRLPGRRAFCDLALTGLRIIRRLCHATARKCAGSGMCNAMRGQLAIFMLLAKSATGRCQSADQHWLTMLADLVQTVLDHQIELGRRTPQVARTR